GARGHAGAKAVLALAAADVGLVGAFHEWALLVGGSGRKVRTRGVSIDEVIGPPTYPQAWRSARKRKVLHATEHRCPERLRSPGSPQVWKQVWTKEIPCKTGPFWTAWCLFAGIEAAPRRCYARRPRNLLRGASRGWRTTSSRLPNACGTTAPAGSVRHATRRPTQRGSPMSLRASSSTTPSLSSSRTTSPAS